MMNSGTSVTSLLKLFPLHLANHHIRAQPKVRIRCYTDKHADHLRYRLAFARGRTPAFATRRFQIPRKHIAARCYDHQRDYDDLIQKLTNKRAIKWAWFYKYVM